MDFISEYEDYVDYIVKKYFISHHDREDMKEFIITSLLKMFLKRYKYDGWDLTVRAAIRRRASDFCNYLSNQTRESLYSEITSRDDDSFSLLDFVYDRTQKNHEVASDREDYVKTLIKRLREDNVLLEQLTDWELEYIDVVIFLYENESDIEKDDIMECMGLELDDSSFPWKLARLRTKLQGALLNV